MKSIFIGTTIYSLTLCISACKSVELFRCPIQNASIIFIEKKGAEAAQASLNAMLVGNGVDVTSISSGYIYRIDSTTGRYDVSIKYKQYIFTYGNLQSILVRDGLMLNKGDHIGLIGKNDTLELAMIKDGFPQRVQKYLKCNTKTVFVN